MPPKLKKAPTPEKYEITSEDVELKAIPGKGQGLVALEDLPPNGYLIYRGRSIDADQMARLEEKHKAQPTKGYISYVMATGHKDQYLDANPSYKEFDEEAWMAGRINEPAVKTKANLILLIRDKQPVFVSTRKIKEGEELTAKYGTSYYRGYRVGQKATKPKWV